MSWYHCSVKKSILIILKNDSTSLSKLSGQTKKLKLQKALGDGQRTSLSYLQKFYLIKKTICYFFGEIGKTSANNEVFEHIKNNFEMEMKKEIF